VPRDPLALAAALKAYLPDGDRIRGVRPISDGFSNETWLVDGLDLILRAPPTGFPLLEPNHVHDVVGQYRILQDYAARSSAPPVPRTVLLETDPSVIGAPFFLMERVACDPWGDFELPGWLTEADDAFRAGVSAQIVDMYARLHALGPLASLGPQSSVRDELGRWRDPVRDLASPALKEAFDLLFASAPEDAAPTACHGDAKIANILWKDGRIVAMLDYEMSFNGDPRWDIAALLQGLKGQDGAALPAGDVRGFWGRDHFLAEWQARTGRSAARLDWFEAAGRARYAAILTYGQHLADQGRSDDRRLAAFGPVAERLSQTALDLARRDAAAHA
jgi:aminoglycoside phosphotransferase (APT) family kinase protein